MNEKEKPALNSRSIKKISFEAALNPFNKEGWTGDVVNTNVVKPLKMALLGRKEVSSLAALSLGQALRKLPDADDQEAAYAHLS